ncbi:Protein YiiM [subsurface metagenome]
MYSYHHYTHWRQELGRSDFSFGQFGENFTVDHLAEEDVYIGDAFRVGSALVEVSQPREPCFKLGLRMDLPTFPKMFLASGKIGFYLRVLEEGAVRAGDVMELETEGAGRLSIHTLWQMTFQGEADPAVIQSALDHPALAPAWRRMLEKRLHRIS